MYLVLVYNFSSPINIEIGHNTVLGIGFPTITCGINTGKPCFVIADGVTGVRLAGFFKKSILNIVQHHYFK